MLHSIYDLTTQCRKTTGDVPAKLVGASTTVVGSKMYLFGGRLVTERRMVSDLYVFDLETFAWERIQAFPEDDVPKPRYFHSADAWNNQLIIFGGMSNQPDSPNPDELCVLNDVRFFDLNTRHWLSASQFPAPASDAFIPRARYAHLSSITSDQLFIIGGQDFFNTWLDDICVYDLLAKTWVERRDYPRHCGTYRSVAVSSHLRVRLPQEEARNHPSPSNSRFRDTPTPTAESTPTDSLIHLPYSAAPTEDHPSDIYLYSNYNFTDVKRELEVFSPLPDTDFTIQDRSSAMTGTTFPPGLRFPTGAILGNHLIIAGTYLAHSYQSFSIWVLDLASMTWSRIDPGKAVETGSWFRGCLWAKSNKFLIFGNRNGNLVDDYNRRLLSWDHVAVVDLEAFGIYQSPPLKLDIHMQQLGLAALEDKMLADFEIICDDDRRISCSRKLLDDRWPWFREQRLKMLRTAKATSETLANSPMDVSLPNELANSEERPDPRLTPRSLHLSESYAVTTAFLQYFYTLSLITPLQHAPAVLSQLLILSVNYQLTHLESLVKHAMHRALSNSTSVGVYEVATLCGCRSLQIRALKTVMSYTQKRPSRRERDGGNGGRPPPDGDSHGGGPNGTDGYSGSNDKNISRPRGTSDARWRSNALDNSANNHVYRTNQRQRRRRNPPVSTSGSEDDQASSAPLFTQPRPSPSMLKRPLSTVSITTDEEIHSIAAMMESAFGKEPVVRPLHTRAKSYDSLDTILDPSLTPLEQEYDNTDDGYAASIDSSGRWSHQGSATSGPDEFELLSPNGEITRVYLPPTPPYPTFHLPKRPAHQHISVGDSSDTPSLKSSTSRSSLGSGYASPMTPGISDFSDSLPAIEERPIEGHDQESSCPERPENPTATSFDEPRPWAMEKSESEKVTMIVHSTAEGTHPQRPLLSPIIMTTTTMSHHDESPTEFDRRFFSAPENSPPGSPSREFPFPLPSLTHQPVSSPDVFTTTYKNSNPVAIGRFFRGKSSDDAVYDARGTKNQEKLDAKAVKEQEKKWRKEVAKAKTENLAIQLKENARKREEAAQADVLSSNSKEKKKKELNTLYRGMEGLSITL